MGGVFVVCTMVLAVARGQSFRVVSLSKNVSRQSGRLKNLIRFGRSVLLCCGGSTIHRSHSEGKGY